MSLILSLIAFVMTSQAQAAVIKWSVMGDVNMMQAKASPATAGQTQSAKLGFGGGVGAEFGLSPNVGLSIEALYEMRKMEVASSGITSSISTAGLVFPIGARIWLSPMFNLFVGGYLSSAMGKIKTDTAGTVTESDYTSTKKTDYGAVGGLGVQFPAGSAHFFVDARYYLGLADLNSPAVAGTTTKISGIQGLVGVRFGGK